MILGENTLIVFNYGLEFHLFSFKMAVLRRKNSKLFPPWGLFFCVL